MKPMAKDLMWLPWGIRGPTFCRDEHGNEWWEMRVEELPGFLVANETREGVMNDYTDALESFLASYTEHGELPPVPTSVLWDWLLATVRPVTTKTASA